MLNTLEEVGRDESDLIDFVSDKNGNNYYEIEQMKYLKMLHESSPDPDSLSIISDFSEMGHEVTQSIRFSDMIISTYSDLKNPNKSIPIVPNTSTDPNMILRKYNMLSLAMEFAKWKELNIDNSEGKSIPENDSMIGNESYQHDSPMISTSPSRVSDLGPECRDSDSEYTTGTLDQNCPLQKHIDNKFEDTFPGRRSSSESEDETTPSRISRVIRPAWAQSIFHRDTLKKMPTSIREATNAIRHFDLSKERYLQLLDLPQLQLILNSLMTQIEELNESLVAALISRDELRCTQTSTVIEVEEMTLRAKTMTEDNRLRRNEGYDRLNYGSVHRFLSNLICSPKVASNGIISFFTQTSVSKLPTPEYV